MWVCLWFLDECTLHVYLFKPLGCLQLKVPTADRAQQRYIHQLFAEAPRFLVPRCYMKLASLLLVLHLSALHSTLGYTKGLKTFL